MGICTSCYSGSTATSTTTVTPATVKLILLDGRLREFAYPVKVFMVVQTLNSFICNADNMDFNDYVTAMQEDDVLHPGQLYFELPLSWSNKRLPAEDMASLAVKAGAALKAVNGSGGKVGCGCWAKRVDPVVFYDGESGGSRRGSGGGDKGRLLTRLERIVE
uniref:uncharacterized protein LOC122591871 n=1 Tax=Erigeron canadensis TaxID=72917 RepID=UPI001CB93208|nr:uncharacterized protein LOC122591871 [Erigeron canadensis]